MNPPRNPIFGRGVEPDRPTKQAIDRISGRVPYLKEYASVWDCRDALGEYFEFYNHRRRHQGLDRRTPWEVYQTGV